jgi:hypothetical protein
MIVIGVAPGLKALTYSVLEFQPELPATCIDKDVLLGPKLPGKDDEPGFLKGLVDIAKKAYVHHLILEVVFERALVPFGRAPKPRAALAIGPPCNPREPSQHVDAVRVMLSTLAHRFSLPVTGVSESQMQLALSASPHESWLRVSNRRLDLPLDTKDPKLVLAVAIGLTLGAKLGELP